MHGINQTNAIILHILKQFSITIIFYYHDSASLLCIFRIFTSGHQRSGQPRDLPIIAQWGKRNRQFSSNWEFKANTMAFECLFYDNCATSYWRKTEAMSGGHWPDLRGHLLTFGGWGWGLWGFGFQNSL